jgi:DNA-binding transcriptional regulator YhcF (GntR family)
MRKTHFSKLIKRKMRRGFLWVDYEIIDDKQLTSSDKIVYMTMARFVDNETQECFPSNKKLAEMTGLTTRTIINAVKHLEDGGYIEVDRAFGRINYYQLNEIPVKNKHRTSEIISQVPVKNKHTNNTYINNTYINNTSKTSFAGKDINEMIDLFKEVNPNYQAIFSNKTERKALEWLVKQHGAEKVINIIKALPKIVVQKYAPKITKPTELKRDLAKILIFVKQNQKGRTIISSI